eukprot:gnl/MRDRNA2_/MRDRNA2_26586_c0_seq1.p1 gnl/MRDRNA2_/MRDRNA2_26586_c0~~gnl/MRDRNA2_/MRDRNA2_26586_c0_seq1.p1  ORF type:complete len:331 (-),score=86.67 gnl/MRDRNA2_/MRDRNA2_26586_c0_seq1:89-1081(-)
MFDFDDMEATGKEELPVPKAETASLPGGGSTPTKETVKKVLAEVGQRYVTSKNWDHQEVLFTVEGGVATVVMNRKERYNMLSDDMMDAFLDLLVELHNSVGKVRVVVVRTSAAGLPFCAGMDVEEAKDSGMQDAEDILKGSRMSAYIYYLWSTLPQYVIGMITGSCMGAGIGLCCAMDLAICLNKPFVSFNFAETKQGMICVSWVHVVAKIGAAKARMVIGQAMQVTPTEAKEMGIIHHLFNEKDDMEKKLKQVIENCNAAAPGAVAHSKHYIADLSGNAPTLEILHWTAEQMASRISSEEKGHAGECFAKKEKPSWEQQKLVVAKPMHY